MFWGWGYSAPCIAAEGDVSGFIQTHRSALCSGSCERLVAENAAHATGRT